ncbi:MAG TPA: hypothetical protein VHO43_02375 [Ignavibacteriales bacterium]|nr:hypothetical protein [Ignavibacteriales bacterium]
MKLLLANGNLVTQDSILENTNIVINEDKIESIEKESNKTDFDEILDVKDCYVLPGFIDLHCHGGYGSDVMDGTPEAINTVGRFHAEGGTAYFLATTASDSLENFLNAKYGPSRWAPSGFAPLHITSLSDLKIRSTFSKFSSESLAVVARKYAVPPSA